MICSLKCLWLFPQKSKSEFRHFKFDPVLKTLSTFNGSLDHICCVCEPRDQELFSILFSPTDYFNFSSISHAGLILLRVQAFILEFKSSYTGYRDQALTIINNPQRSSNLCFYVLEAVWNIYSFNSYLHLMDLYRCTCIIQ